MPKTDPRVCVSSLVAVVRTHRAVVDKQVRMGLPIHRSQHMMLMMIAREKEAVTQKDISRRLDISEAAVTTCLRRLEEEGYITRMTDVCDGRLRRICLTDAGREIVKKTEGMFGEIDRRIFTGFSDAEMYTLCNLLDRLRENLAKMADDDAPSASDDNSKEERG